eukprot:2386836-Amphidinium_carterae.2
MWSCQGCTVDKADEVVGVCQCVSEKSFRTVLLSFTSGKDPPAWCGVVQARLARHHPPPYTNLTCTRRCKTKGKREELVSA